MKMLRGVVLDLEDTLFDKTDWVIPAIEYAAAQFGLDMARTAELLYEYAQRSGGLDSNIYNHVLVGCGQFDTAMNVRALCAWANQYRPQRGSIQLYPGAVAALEILGKHYKLAVVAEGQPEAQRLIVDALGLEPMVHAIVYSDQIDGVRSRRPDPRGVVKAAQQLNLLHDDVLWVADNPAKDFIQVRQLSVPTARVLTGSAARQDPPSQAHAADFNISSIARLPALMEELQSSELDHASQAREARLIILHHERRA
jgi:putative hydrolase of the HAD superfamily